MNIGDAIKRLRLAKGLKQKDLAALLNVSNRTVSSWEINRTEPNMDAIEAICKVLDCTKSELLDEPIDFIATLSDKEIILIELYRKADTYDKTAVDRILKYAEKIAERKENGKS